jgi:protein involved in polysaccharide export with SLBB domain
VLALMPLVTSCGLMVQRPEMLPTIVHRTVRPGDVLQVRDRDQPEPPMAILTVDAAGDVHLPDAGSLPVVGYTAEDVEAVMASFSLEPDHRVAVEILPPRTRFWVYGEVRRGGRRVLRPGMTVGQAIAAAKVRGSQADPRRVWVLRAGQEALEVTLGSSGTDVQLQDGDVLVVPPPGAGRQPGAVAGREP